MLDGSKTVDEDVLAPRHRASMLRAKLRPPTLPDHFVHRPRLDHLLDESIRRPIVVVDAPAGSGKTMLVASWISRSPVFAVAWLSLDDADADAAQFWFDLIAALETLVPGCGEAAFHSLARSAPLLSLVSVLLDDLEGGSELPSALVVDDVHLLTDRELTDAFSTFLQHLPAWLHVVLISRTVPDLPLDRLRGRGQLAQIRFAELRLSEPESRAVLARLAPMMSDEQLDAAVMSSDGWAAGVQLAALAARSAEAQAVHVGDSFDDRSLIDAYTWHEVLATSDPALVEVLVAVSVIDRVSAGVAVALTDRADAAELLLRAEARGMFVSRLGSDHWFRIHPLVRSALYDELVRRSGHLEQHGRAARWLEDAGEIPDALEQWMLADRPLEALRLLAAQSSMLYDTGREATIKRVIATLPLSTVYDDVSATLDFAFSHVLVSRRRFLEQVDRAAWLGSRTEVDETVKLQLSMVQAIAMIIRGDWSDGLPVARHVMANLPDWRADPFGRYGWNTIARFAALQETWDEDSGDARDALMATSRDPDRGLSLEGIRAVGLALAGRPVDALRVAAGVRHAVSNMSILGTELAIAEAVARRELGDRTRGVMELEALADTPVEPTLYCRVLAMLELAAAHLDEGDLAIARANYDRAEALVADEGIGSGMRDWFGTVATRLWLAEESPKEAERSADSIKDPFWRPVSQARVRLAVGETEVARKLLASVEPRCVRHQVVLGLIRARATEDPDAEQNFAAMSFQLASEHGMLQTVATECRDAMGIIERSAWRVPDEWMSRVRRAAARAATDDGGELQLVEPLTERERDVLRLLPSRLTLREIAGELYVSMNTLKFHLRVIYRKLGVNSRDEAAAYARAATSVRQSH